MQPINLGCLNIHRIHATANNSINNNVFIFCFRFENIMQ